MLKLALRVFVLTFVLMAASLVFAEELVVSTLILVTIALTALAMVLGRNEIEDSPSTDNPS